MYVELYSSRFYYCETNLILYIIKKDKKKLHITTPHKYIHCL